MHSPYLIASCTIFWTEIKKYEENRNSVLFLFVCFFSQFFSPSVFLCLRTPFISPKPLDVLWFFLFFFFVLEKWSNYRLIALLKQCLNLHCLDVCLGLTALRESISVFIEPSPMRGRKKRDIMAGEREKNQNTTTRTYWKYNRPLPYYYPH